MRPWIMFTKHLEGWDLGQIIDGLKQGGVEGADLCVRPGPDIPSILRMRRLNYLRLPNASQTRASASPLSLHLGNS